MTAAIPHVPIPFRARDLHRTVRFGAFRRLSAERRKGLVRAALSRISFEVPGKSAVTRAYHGRVGGAWLSVGPACMYVTWLPVWREPTRPWAEAVK